MKNVLITIFWKENMLLNDFFEVFSGMNIAILIVCLNNTHDRVNRIQRNKILN